MWKSIQEIEKHYDQHYDSVRDWGGEADLDSIKVDKARAIAQFLTEHPEI